jgi:hypothetical protein
MKAEEVLQEALELARKDDLYHAFQVWDRFLKSSIEQECS